MIICLVYLIVLFVFDPLFKSCCEHICLSKMHVFIGIPIMGLIMLYLIFIYGKTPPFKLYGTVAILVNNSTVIYAIILLDKVFNPNTSNANATIFRGLNVASLLYIFLSSINILTFLFYGYDKLIAILFPKPEGEQSVTQILTKRKSKVSRVPEWILHWHSIFGGSIGALFAQKLFHHKTKSEKFQPVYTNTLLVQVGLLIAIFTTLHLL